MPESNIYLALCYYKLVLEARHNVKKKSRKETRYKILYTTFLCKIYGRKKINFNDLKSPESPSAAMNYATHQKNCRKYSNIHHDSTVSLPHCFTEQRQQLFYSVSFYSYPFIFCCLQPKTTQQSLS